MGNRFYEIPTEDLQQIDPEWENRRRNVDGTKAIIHVETLDELVRKHQAMIQSLGEEQPIEIPYPIYGGEELEALLASIEWLGAADEI